ncbi:tyrosine-protein phosphatase [Psychrobacillus sp. NEAU-3TGS]|uniref:tyrosine-protein phosphatase n=1 Tax=Psychrobacillus sp. NEAU-3TGS TaxID=2995412 RepID=UPI002498BF9A|nr:CpsB/CapC family capsule biosynthesis tyrosine phosphatase [Psychrobacillus sp. NEAU-3TGS]MDI2586534.1 tyrosine-protein phosphatase [Psychrobacillus sp. NEAU-3TGS]
MLVDIHNYILPVDERPGNDEGAIRLAKQAVENGITHIIAAPHSMNKACSDFEPWIKHLVTNLNKKLIELNIPLTVLEGMEVQLKEGLLDDVEKQFLPLAGTNKYILIELPKNRIPAFTQKLFYEIQLKGYIPIIAHPEQNAEIVKNPAKLFELVNKGALVQVNAASMLGIHGRRIKRFVKKYVDIILFIL